MKNPMERKENQSNKMHRGERMKTILSIALVFATASSDLCSAIGAYAIYNENGEKICEVK